MASVYDIGDKVILRAAFDTDGAPNDPTTLTAQVRRPDGTMTTYTYLTTADIVRDSTGRYHLDVVIDQAGTWYVRWAGTGTAQAAEEESLWARPSAVV